MLSSCSSETPTPSPPPTEPLQIEVSPTPPPTETLDRYINEEGGFSLILPEGWSAAGPFRVQVDDDLFYNMYQLGMNPSEQGGPGTSRIMVADASRLTIERFVEQQCSTCPQQDVEAVEFGGIAGQRTVIGGGSVPFDVEWYFFENAGRLIGLSIHDVETLKNLDSILETLQLE